MFLIILVSISLCLIGIWLFYVNYVYAGVEPMLQNGFICLVGGLLLICGIWANNFDVTIQAPWTAIFPASLLCVYWLIVHAFPDYTYEQAKTLVSAVTNDDLFPRHKDFCVEDGMYCFYTDRRTYHVDPQSGEIFEYYALSSVQ